MIARTNAAITLPWDPLAISTSGPTPLQYQEEPSDPYLLDAERTQKMNAETYLASCIFCKIGAGTIPSAMIHSDDICFVIRDIHQRAPKHLLVILQKHFLSLADMHDADEAMLGHMIGVAAHVAKKEKIAASGYRLVINQGHDSGQEVPHLHLHILGGHKLSAMG